MLVIYSQFCTDNGNKTSEPDWSERPFQLADNIKQVIRDNDAIIRKSCDNV